MAKLTSSGYKAIDSEANFGHTIRDEIVGGMHIAPEIIAWNGKKFYAVHWFHGLPRHDKINGTRFPHGLMLFGESVRDCASRLVKEQLGMKVKNARVLTLESYVDSENHWHMEPEVLATVSGKPRKPARDTEIVEFELKDTPGMAFWKSSDFRKFIRQWIE